MFIIYIFLLIGVYFIYKFKFSKYTTGWKNFVISVLNYLCFVVLMAFLTFKPKHSPSFAMRECFNLNVSLPVAINKVFERSAVGYGRIYIALVLTILISAFLDYHLLMMNSAFFNNKNGKTYYNLDTSKAVIDKIVTVTALVGAFIIVLYKVKTKHSIPNVANFAANFQYIFALYLIPLQCAIDYIIAKNKVSAK